ncbi:MAG: glycosyltransferase [Vicinamibacterales bacterium]
MLTACTIVARNYLAHARVLARSFHAQHPRADFVVLVIDDQDGTLGNGSEPFRVVRLDEIGLDPREVRRQAVIYDTLELATAVKPVLLDWLLRDGRSAVMYLDPDVKVFAPLDRVFDLARAHAIVLTPHTTAPIPDDGRWITAQQIMAAGIYNLGFIAIGARARPFLAWWAGRTRRDALNAPERMLFTDQRWIDFVPGLFEHVILTEPGYNVAYWNLHAQSLSWREGRYAANGEPLRFFHFSGFDCRTPHLLSRHQGPHPRFLLSEHPALARLCEEYAEDLASAGVTEQASADYGWARVPMGLSLDARVRRMYRDALVTSEIEATPEPPNPFVPGEREAFVDWLRQPQARAPRTLSRYLQVIYQSRPDLQHAFPRVLAGETRDYFRWVHWAHRYGLDREAIPPELLPPTEEPESSEQPEPSRGVTVVGYLRSASGVGESARRLLQALSASGNRARCGPTTTRQAPSMLAPTDRAHTDQLRRQPDLRERRRTAAAGGRVGPHSFEDGIPADSGSGSSNASRTACHQPSTTWTRCGAHRTSPRERWRPGAPARVPGSAPTGSSPVEPGLTRRDLGLTDHFTFLFCFDFLSDVERKNPLGIMQAFRRAFEPRDGARLVIKTMNGDQRLLELEALRAAARSADVTIMDAALPAGRAGALVAACDCYVSLHRSEGLGLTMAEAMALGKPVIATGYSGNLTFMTERNSFLVDYGMTTVPPGRDAYPEGAAWAEPDLDEAARAMRLVFERPADAARRAGQGQLDILTSHGVDACAPVIAERLARIRTGRRAKARIGRSVAALAAQTSGRAPPPSASANSPPSTGSP